MNQAKQASEILGNPDYPAFCFGGFRELTRDSVPTVNQLKEGLGILSAMKVKMLRTYNTTGDKQVANLLQAITELKQANPEFEMYVMLGAWISCFIDGDSINHEAENYQGNKAEIEEAIRLAKQYPDIVKIIAVGNESMVHWQGYHVSPAIVLNWVNDLQNLKTKGELPSDLWITSSDNFASWGGGGSEYHKPELIELIKAVDFVAMHSYPFHDTHYTPEFWLRDDTTARTHIEKVQAGMRRATDYCISQYESVKAFIESQGIKNKPIHLTETGWASQTNYLYGDEGSRAADEYKQKLYYDQILAWSRTEGVTCFYFEIFDEQWKDANNPLGSENHFGLINLKSQVKYALWDLVDQGVFDGLSRNGYPVTKSFNGDENELIRTVKAPRTLELQPN
jgi:exo-beta-1,3-glucanase (GH17 family)